MSLYKFVFGAAGSMHVQWKEWSEASKDFDKLVAIKDLRHDAYARVGLGNIQLYTAPVDDKRVSLILLSLIAMRDNLI